MKPSCRQRLESLAPLAQSVLETKQRFPMHGVCPESGFFSHPHLFDPGSSENTQNTVIHLLLYLRWALSLLSGPGLDFLGSSDPPDSPSQVSEATGTQMH